MRIVIEGFPKEGSSMLAFFIRDLLRRWGVPCDIADKDGPTEQDINTVKRKMLKISESLEAPLQISTRVLPKWQDHLEMDPEVDDVSPVVKGTWVTVSQILSMIVDKWEWKDILRKYPELCEDDIRAAISYATLQGDFEDGNCQTNCGNLGDGYSQESGRTLGEDYGGMGSYVRITGRPHPIPVEHRSPA